MIMDEKYQAIPFSNATAENGTVRPNKVEGFNFDKEIAMLLTIAATIVLVNSVVFYLFIKEKVLRTTSNYPLFSLAVCDFICGFVVIPLFTTIHFTSLVESLEAKFYLGFLVTVLHNFVAIATVYHIVVVTAERYIAIIFPLKHRVIRKKCIQKVLVIVWSCSLMISLIPYTWIDKIFPVYHPECSKYVLGFTAFCLLFAMIVPYIFMVFAFAHMSKAIHATSPKKHQRATFQGRRHSLHLKATSGEWKCLVLFAIMAFVFFVCWAPWFVLSLLHHLPISLRLGPIAQVALLIRYTTSVLNPLLYTFLKRDFLRALKFVFRADGLSRRLSSTFSVFSLRRPTLQTDPNHSPGEFLPGRDSPPLLAFQREVCFESTL